MLKLNLGSGQNPESGYVNVDKYAPADVVHDLEWTPWPWADSSVDEIRANHVLEHLGATERVFIAVMREMYRVCKPGAIINIVFPYPFHPSFFSDPGHIRPLMPETFLLFSKKFNRECADAHMADSPLGERYDIDFEPVTIQARLEKEWEWILGRGDWTQDEKRKYAERHIGAIKEVAITLRVIK
jgi:SAM-dependent methyltransferase